MFRSLTALGLALLASPVIAQQAAPSPAPLQVSMPGNPVLPAGTEVPLRMAQELSTKGDTWQENDTFVMTVAQDVRHNGFVVIPRGSRATGRITFLTSKGMFGKSGKMDIEIESVEVNGRVIKLDGTYRQEGEGNTLATVGGVVLVGVFGGFITGKSARIPQGRELTATLEEPIELSLPSRAANPSFGTIVPSGAAGTAYSPAASYAQTATSPYEDLVATVEQAAKTYARNYDLGEGMIVNSFEADGGALVLNTNIAPSTNPANVARAICSNPGMQSVMVYGGTVAVSFGNNDLRLTRQTCGI